MELTWTTTSLAAFETCPKRYYLTRVAKEVREPPSEASDWGNRVHTLLETAIVDGAPLPTELAHMVGIVDFLKSRPGELKAEFRLAVDASFQPADWDKAWCRGIVDVGVVGTTKAVLIDWKTGKRKPGSDQMALYAGMMFAHYPQLEQTDTAYAWIKELKVDRYLFTREQVPDIWQGFLPRVRRLELAYEKNAWPARPSGLCRKWCPVGRSRCEFCGT